MTRVPQLSAVAHRAIATAVVLSTLGGCSGRGKSSSDTSLVAGTAAAVPQAMRGQSPVTFYCKEGAISAAFADNGMVLTLPDDRRVSLTQVVAGSGIRYQSTTPSILFSSKGDNATVEENGRRTYTDCLAGTITLAISEDGWQRFTNRSRTFQFAFPNRLVLSGGDDGASYTRGWRANATSSGLLLAQVTVPRREQPGTNFAGATFTVGVSPDASAVAQCTRATNGELATGDRSINGTTFATFTLRDAGAGNYYDIRSYRVVRGGMCYAVESTIHSTNIQNYDPSQGVSAFNKAAVEGTLAGMVESFTFRASD